MVDMLTAADRALPREDGDGESIEMYGGAEYRNAKKALHSLDKLDTPYGRLMETFVFHEDEPDAGG